MMWRSWHQALSAALSLLMVCHPTDAYDLDVKSDTSIKGVAKDMAADLMSLYNGHLPGGTPGLLPLPYYWWEAGAFLGAMVDYWYYTGDTTYNKITEDGLLFQVGPFNDYMPPNQTLTEGNDDQGFWGMAVMSAAEYQFPNPAPDQPQWLALAQAVFNTQAARWDTQYCNGGLRWQIFQWNNGYTYKNAISQACFFNIAARLALYTGNSSYADWAVKTWDWMVGVKLIDENYYIFDGSHIETNCTNIVPYQFSYNPGAFLLGAAAMYAWADKSNRSSDREIWHERVDGLLNGTDVFFFSQDDSPKIMFEVACEGVNLCNVDQRSFKAYLSRWMAATTKWAPWTYNRIKPLLENSATAAAKQCKGGANQRMCGMKWANNSGNWDGTTGVGQQMAAMEVVLANMIQQAQAPVTDSTGGTSRGDPGGGGSDIGRTNPIGSFDYHPITPADRAGAIICTVVVLFALFTAMIFMMTDENKSTSEKWDGFRGSFVPGVGAAVLRKGKTPGSSSAKGKGKEPDRSSTETGEKIPSAFGGVLVGAPDHPTRPAPRTPRPPRSRVTISDASSIGMTASEQRLSRNGGTRRSLQKKNKGSAA